MEPVLLGTGFVLNEVVVGPGPVTAPLMGYVGRGRRLARLLRRSRAGTASAATTTSVLYEADAQEFAAAYPGSVERPEGADCKDLWLHFHESTGSVAVDLQGQDLQCGIAQREPLAVVVEAVLAAQEADDHAHRLVLAVALHERIDVQRARIGGQCTGPGTEHRPPTCHVIELHHPLSDVERVVVGQ